MQGLVMKYFVLKPGGNDAYADGMNLLMPTAKQEGRQAYEL